MGASLLAKLVKNLSANKGDTGDMRSILGLGRSPWKRKWQPNPVFLPREFHGQRSLAGYIPRDHKELDMAEHTPTTMHQELEDWVLTLTMAREIP